MSSAAVAEAELPVEGAPSKKKGFGLVKILIIVVPLLLLVGGGAAAYLSGMFGGSTDKAKAAAPPPKPIETVFLDVTDMLVNLNTGTRHPSYLKLTISLQLESKDDIPKVQALMPRVVDTCQNYLRELRLEDLRGSGGLYRLREELLMRIGTAIAPIKLDDVLFKDLLVQ